MDVVVNAVHPAAVAHQQHRGFGLLQPADHLGGQPGALRCKDFRHRSAHAQLVDRQHLVDQVARQGDVHWPARELARARNARSILVRALATDSIATEQRHSRRKVAPRPSPSSLVSCCECKPVLGDRHLAGDDQHRDMVHRRVGHGGDDIGRPGSRREDRGRRAGGPGESVGKVAGAALVPCQHDLKVLVLRGAYQQ